MIYRIFFFCYKVLGIIFCSQFWHTDNFWIWMSLFIALYFVVVAIGSYYLKFNFFIESMSKGLEDGVMLTFDDGPHPETTPKILNLLKEQNVKATFFIIGKEAEKYPQLVKQINDEGHLIGNHSYSHSNFLPFFWSRKLKKDFKKAEGILKDITGKETVYIRPPFGATSPSYYKLLRKTSYKSIGWSFRSFDTLSKNKEDLKTKTFHAISLIDNPILLFHDTQQITLEVLPDILNYIKEKGKKTILPR